MENDLALISAGPGGQPIRERIETRLMRRRLNEFLDAVNEVVSESAAHLPNFEIEGITVAACFSRGGEISFAGFGGLNLTGTRTIEFTIRPKR